MSHRYTTLTVVFAVWLTRCGAADDLPIVPEGFVVDVVAKEPMVSNPCVMAFDRQGRLFVGQGPQWRSPKPDTPGDRVDILIDDDDDGVADRRKTFARGFNCIQGLAWRGRDLWVANSPDLTIVRDLDGDDEADEYVRVYTGLGNLEHALHGLNFGPDGKLYMSKGNSKGYNRLDQLAPKPFRDLWGLKSPEGAPDYTAMETYKKGEYRKKYHTPADDWGQQGGILRCNPDGRGLEIVARGFRNPWDIAFDDEFNWLGTDNDQTQGDKIFAPFYGAQFGWGHAWSAHWSGEGHLPTVPASAPLFEGSGAGVVHYHAEHFPPKYRTAFFVNDWLRREVYLFRPQWDGALLKCEDGFPTQFAHAGGVRSLGGGSGRVFAPTDIEVGPDGALYLLSWSHGYGSNIDDGKQTDAGRVYRIRHGASELAKWQGDHRGKPIAQWSWEQLFADLGSHMPVWRTDAQNELLRRGEKSRSFLADKLSEREFKKAEFTWALWTLGRLAEEDADIEQQLTSIAEDADAAPSQRIQAIRILAFRIREFRKQETLPQSIVALLNSPNSRIRHAVVQAIWQAKQAQCVSRLLDLAAGETDRIVFYTTWNALSELATIDDRRAWVADERPGVRLAALLGLFDDGSIGIDAVAHLRRDTDERVAGLVNSWLKNRGGASPPNHSREPMAPRFRQQAFISDIQAQSGRDYVMDWNGLAVGKRHYTDRTYYVTSVPAGIDGLPLLQTANNDDRSSGDDWLQMKSDSEVTVWVGVDVRVNAPLAWMQVGQQGGFDETGLKLVTTDPTFRLYKKHFPAGRIVLGGSTNHPNTDSRRGNYIVAFERQLLKPDPKSATSEAILSALPTSDVQRGRELFMHPRGAGCIKCHRMEGYGAKLAPDLADIGTRAPKAELLIESILNPSAAITEGFAQQRITTTRGKTLSGAVLEETGQSLKLVDSEGTVTSIRKVDIDQREGTKLSSMPEGFGKLMSAQQIADVVAWLQTQKSAGDRNGFSFRDHKDRIDIQFGEQRIATYLKEHSQLTRRALVNVTTARGVPVTRRFPALDSEDHAVMHPGIWISFGDVDGNDYWRLQARVAFDGFVEQPAGDRESGSFAVRNHLLSEDGKRTVCTEITRYRFTRAPSGILLRLDAEYQSDERDFYFGDQEESGLSVRVASPLCVQGGEGAILNDRGDRNADAMWGKEAKWFDYFANIDGRQVGVMVVSSPDNPRPSWLHARDYGVVVTNPFPKQPQERREPYIKTWVKQGERYRLSYAVLIHDLPADEPLDRNAAFRAALEMLDGD